MPTALERAYRSKNCERATHERQARNRHTARSPRIPSEDHRVRKADTDEVAAGSTTAFMLASHPRPRRRKAASQKPIRMMDQ
jgi:hypothetical protein